MEASKIKDFWTGLFLFCISILLYFYLIPNYVTTGSGMGMSPRFFPSMAAILLGVLSLLLTSFSFVHLKRAGRRIAFLRYQELLSISNVPIKKRTLYVLLILVVFFLLFEHLGFFVATPFALASMMLAFGQRKWVLIISISISLPVLLYFLFTFGLKMPLN